MKNDCGGNVLGDRIEQGQSDMQDAAIRSVLYILMKRLYIHCRHGDAHGNVGPEVDPLTLKYQLPFAENRDCRGFGEESGTGNPSRATVIYAEQLCQAIRKFKKLPE